MVVAPILKGLPVLSPQEDVERVYWGTRLAMVGLTVQARMSGVVVGGSLHALSASYPHMTASSLHVVVIECAITVS